MKGKQLALLLGLVIVIGGAGLLLQRRNQQSWSASASGPAAAKIVNLPLNEVARITIKSAAGELNLVRTNDIWAVKERADYPANFEQVSDLLRKVWDLKPVQEVKVGASQFARLDLEEPGTGAGAGTRMEFQDQGGKSLAALLLGKKFLKKGDASFGDMGGMPAGRYVLPLAGAAKVSLVSESFDEVEPKAENWLVRDFFKIDNAKSVVLAGPVEAQRWKLTRESATAEWQLDGAKPGEADPSKASALISSLARPSFTDVLAPDAKPADTGLDQPAILTAETFDGFTYILKFGKVTGESRPLTVEVAGNFSPERVPGKDEKPEDKTKLDEEFKTKLKRFQDKLAAEKKLEGRAYLLAKTTVDEMAKDRTAFLAEKKPEGAPGMPGEAPPGAAVTPAMPMPPMPPGHP